MKLCLLSLYLLSLSLFAAETIVLRSAAQNNAPKYYFDEQGNYIGICVDIIRAIEDVSDLRIHGYETFRDNTDYKTDLGRGRLDVVFGLARNSLRENFYTYPNKSLYPVYYTLVMHRDESLQIQGLESVRTLGKEGVIGTVLSSSSTRYLAKEEGLSVDDKSVTVSELLQRVANKELRFGFHNKMVLHHYIKEAGLEDELIVLSFPLREGQHWAAFSKFVSQDTIDKFEQALQKITDDGTLDRIKMKYGITDDVLVGDIFTAQ